MPVLGFLTTDDADAVTVAQSSVVRRFLLQPGTHCQTTSTIRRSAKTLRRSLRHARLRCIRAHSALDALHNALYKCFAYLLTDDGIYPLSYK